MADDVPDIVHEQRERGRLRALGKSIDDGSRTTLLAIHEYDGAWSFHGLGAPGLSKADTIALAESILERAR